MSVIPPWALGRNVSSLAIFGATEASDGTVTVGSSTALTGKLENISLESNPEQLEVSALDATRQNYVIVKDGSTLTLTEILQRGGSGPNVLATFSTTYDLGQFTVARGGKTWTFLGRRGAYRETFDKGRLAGQLTLTMVDPGTANPTYA